MKRKIEKRDISYNQLLTIKQVADYLQMDTTTIYGWAQQGKLPAIKVGRNWRFRKEKLDQWLEQREINHQSVKISPRRKGRWK